MQWEYWTAFTLGAWERCPSTFIAGHSCEHPLCQEPTLEFGHGPGARVQGPDFILGHKSEHWVPLCTVFFSVLG